MTGPLVKVALSTNTCPKNTLAQRFTQSLSKALWHKLYTRQTPLYFITSVNLYVVHIFSCTLQNHPSYVYHQFSLSILLTQCCSIVCDENVVPIFRYSSSQISSFNFLFSCGFSKPITERMRPGCMAWERLIRHDSIWLKLILHWPLIWHTNRVLKSWSLKITYIVNGFKN